MDEQWNAAREEHVDRHDPARHRVARRAQQSRAHTDNGAERQRRGKEEHRDSRATKQVREVRPEGLHGGVRRSAARAARRAEARGSRQT